MGKVKVEHRHQCHEQQACHEVGGYGVFEFAAYFLLSVNAVKLSHNGCETVGKAEIEQQNKCKNIVHQSCGGKLVCAVVPNHQRVGKAEHYGAQLPNDYGRTYFDEFAILSGVVSTHYLYICIGEFRDAKVQSFFVACRRTLSTNHAFLFKWLIISKFLGFERSGVSCCLSDV